MSHQVEAVVLQRVAEFIQPSLRVFLAFVTPMLAALIFGQ
jgi:hypothetical protein